MKDVYKFIIAGACILAMFFIGYNYGYNKASIKYENIALEEKARLEEKIKGLENQLALASAELEQWRAKTSQIEESNKEWKAKNKEANNKAFDLATVKRLNALLSSLPY